MEMSILGKSVKTDLRMNFQMNMSDTIFNARGQTLENMLNHNMIQGLFNRPGNNTLAL
jgi:hypothetical protein